jgi:hypothetical protein
LRYSQWKSSKSSTLIIVFATMTLRLVGYIANSFISMQILD